MTLHHGCLRLLLTCLPVMWATAEPRVGDADMALAPFKHQDTPRSKFFFFHGKAWGKSSEDPAWSCGSPVNLTYLRWLSLLSFWTLISKRDTKTSVLNIHGYCEVHNALQKMKSTVQRELIMLLSPASSSIIIFTHTQVLATTLRHRSTSVPLLTLTSLLFFSLILGLRAV